MKAIQFTIDEKLLRRVDAEPEVKANGRSAFLRNAIEEYLKRRRQRSIGESYRRGYGAKPVQSREFEVDREGLAWPDD